MFTKANKAEAAQVFLHPVGRQECAPVLSAWEQGSSDIYYNMMDLEDP